MKTRIVESLQRAGISPEQVKNVLTDLAYALVDAAEPMRCEMGDCGGWLREQAWELYFTEFHECQKRENRGEPFTIPSENSGARIGRRETDGKWILTHGELIRFLYINACPFCGDTLMVPQEVTTHENPER